MKAHVHAIVFDRGSARTVDENGFLHVKDCNISKATVNPYWGQEIPDYQQLGLQPDKVYYLLRDPKELAKAAPTFNNLPLMDDHIAVGADELEDENVKDRIAGATGTGARFEDPYLVNDLVVWTAGGIDGVMSKRQTELSCAYRYKLDMTPGVYQGQPYDGRMYDIVGNHVALVDEGRAGHDVVVKDRKPLGIGDKLHVKIDLKHVAAIVADALRPVKKELGMDVAPDDIDGLIDRLTALKAEITETLKPGASDADGKTLDDCTSAIDLAVHHLLDFKEDQDAASETARDDNPEGINQYTGAAGHADRVGKAAGKAGGPSHKDAQGAHQRAAVAANKAGNPSATSQHLRVAAAHGALHSDPSNESAKATLAGHYGKGGDSVTVEDDNPEGINQYTGGGGKSPATKASIHAYGAAKGAKTKSDHQYAASAHRVAASRHEREGNKTRAEEHHTQAAMHTRLAGQARDSVTVDVAEREDVDPKTGKQAYGNVKFADPKNKRYPIDTPDHVRSALSYWGRQRNRNMYSKEDQTTITNNINAAAKKFKIGDYAESK